MYLKKLFWFGFEIRLDQKEDRSYTKKNATN